MESITGPPAKWSSAMGLCETTSRIPPNPLVNHFIFPDFRAFSLVKCHKGQIPQILSTPRSFMIFPCLSFTEISIVNDQFLRLIHFTSNVWASPCSDGKMIGQWWDNMGLCGKNIAHQFTANPTKLCAYWSSTFWSWFLPCFHGGNFFSNFKIPGTVSPFLSSTASETLQRSSLFSVLLVSNLRPSPRRAIRNQLQEANWSGWWF